MTQIKDRMGFDFKFIHTNKDGEVLYDSGFQPNQMSDDGFESMFDVFFRDATPPTGFEIGLTTSNPSKDDSIGDLNEVSGTNYSRQTVEKNSTGFPTLGLDVGDIQIETKQVEFENTNPSTAWDTATDGFLSAVMSGTDDVFVCWKALSVNRTLQPGDKLHVIIKQKGKDA